MLIRILVFWADNNIATDVNNICMNRIYMENHAQQTNTRKIANFVSRSENMQKGDTGAGKILCPLAYPKSAIGQHRQIHGIFARCAS